jgi:hypothetical protein
MTDDEFLSKLKKLCLEYDVKAGSYPDPDYVGFALYYFALHPDADLNTAFGNEIDTEFSEGGKEYSEELDKLEDD